jgi:NitT/TauT family transport system substrate-binding protein
MHSLISAAWRKRGLLSALGAILLAAVAGYVLGYPRLTTQSIRKITIAQAGDFFLYAPLYIAADAGLFRKRNLDVNLVSTGGDEKTWAAVLGGSASFGVADPTFVAIADSRGQPGRVISSVVNGVPFWGITFRENIRPFDNLKSLESYSVATFPSPSTAFTLQKKMFVQAGLAPNIREGAFGTLIAMLKGSKADIALELEPNVSQAVRDGARILYGMPELYGDFAITGLTTTPQILAAQPGIAADVVCALQEALDYARVKPAESLALLVKRFPEIEPAVAKGAFERVILAKIVPIETTVTAPAWDRAVALRVEAGDLKSAKPMMSYVDNTFAKSAAEKCRLK